MGRKVIITAALAGSGRAGKKDNLYYRKGELASNEMLVARAARTVREMELQVATPAEARDLLGINPLHG